MSNTDKLRAMKAGKLGAPPTTGAGNVVEAVEPVKGKSKGRPPLDYPTQQLGARVHKDTFRRVQLISKRERVGLGPLVDRMVREWERLRLSQAEAMGPRQEGESDDDYIARVFRL